MKHKEIVRELIAVGISLNIREINYNEAVALINKNLLEYSKLNNLSLSAVGQRSELFNDRKCDKFNKEVEKLKNDLGSSGYW